LLIQIVNGKAFLTGKYLTIAFFFIKFIMLLEIFSPLVKKESLIDFLTGAFEEKK